MPLDAFCLRGVCRELREEVTGIKIEKVQQPARDQVILQLRGGKKLLLNAGANQPRIHLTELQRENPMTPPMFCMLLRKHLTGGRILSLEQPELERMVRLKISVLDELGQESCRDLVLECMGRHSNLILLDAEERIIDCLRRVDAEMSPQRQVLPGLFYHFPPVQAKLNPLCCDMEKMAALLENAPPEQRLDEWVLDTFFGFSPLIAREIAFQTAGNTELRCGELTAPLQKQALAVLEKIMSQADRPTILLRGGKPADFSYCPILQYGDSVVLRSEESFSRMLDDFYESREQQERIHQRGQELLKTAKTVKDRLQRKLQQQEQEYADTQNREQYRIYGDLITANLYRMQRGERTLRTENFYADNAMTEVTLDPLLTPQQNAARYYKLYNKAKTAEKVLAEQIEKACRERDYLESVLQELQQAELEQDFLDIRQELQQAGYLRGGKEKKQACRSSKPRVFYSSAGLRILVGRNNQQNDQLTLREADKNDLWFHAQKIHGSHVILCIEGKLPDQKSVEEAAELAAFYSQGRDGGQMAVDYTPVRQVKKPSGARPGMVIYHGYQTVYVTPDAAKVKALTERHESEKSGDR